MLQHFYLYLRKKLVPFMQHFTPMTEENYLCVDTDKLLFSLSIITLLLNKCK